MINRPRGTRDLDQKEMQKREHVENVMRSTFINFGYNEIQTPTFENLDLFTAKSGEEIIEEIYSFKDKGGRNLALRPELTAPVIRFYVDKLQMEPKPLKLFYFGNCYRYDRPQKGRYREFMQAGCELIGTDTSEAYAELIALAYYLLKNVGIKNIKLKIGDLNVLSIVFKNFGISKEKQKYLTPLIDKEQFDEIKDALIDFEISENNADRFIDILKYSKIEKIKDCIKNDNSSQKKLERLEEILELLKSSFGITDCGVKISIVRGLDYYKGIVFEIEDLSLGAEKQLCGGGSYELISLFEGTETPTSGFAIGLDRTIVALENEGYKFPESKLDYYVIPINKEMIKKSLEITQSLRNKGFSADLDLMRRGLSKALKYSDSVGAKKIIIVGPNELQKKSVTIRDMNTGEQKLVKINDLTKD